MSDAVRIICEAAHLNNFDLLDVVTKVDEFYNNSWNKLIWVLGSFFVITSAVTIYKYSVDKKEFSDLKKETEEGLKDVSTTMEELHLYLPYLREVKRKDDRRDQIAIEEMRKAGLPEDGKETREVMSNILERYRVEGLL